MKKPDLLLIADSERDADMLYATRFLAPDPFVFFRRQGRTFVIVNDLEFDRAHRQARVDRVLSLSALQKQFPKTKNFPTLIASTLRHFHVHKVRVPANFPLGLAQQLRRARLKLYAAKEPIFPERQIKTPDEVRKISAALRIAEAGLSAGIEKIRAARVGRDGFLHRGRSKLTAEAVRAVIDVAIARRGGVTAHTIVACSNQACDPHERGHGPLRANRAIVMDIFPRDSATGYWGDITRTVVRGRASNAIRKIYSAVSHAQQIAFEKIRDGADGKKIHEAIINYFNSQGYKTTRRGGHMRGFFHGTGHSLGLEIHEAPGISLRKSTLRAGNVVTVEPGLYYPGIGGVRLEDVVVITRTGNRCLTQFPKQLEI